MNGKSNIHWRLNEHYLSEEMYNDFWGDAVVTEIYLINRMPPSILEYKTLLEALSKYANLLSILFIPPRVFGCVAFVNLHKNQRTKLYLCVVRCVFLRYGPPGNKKCYKHYDPMSKHTYVTMDITLLEYEMFCALVLASLL